MIAALDWLYLALFVVLSVVDHFVLWRGFVRRAKEENPGGARRWLWSAWMIELWTLAALGVALWFVQGRAWESLRFSTPHGWRLWVEVSVILAFAGAAARTALKVQSSRRTKRVKISNPSLGIMVPQTRSELGQWVALSLSAGFCEEFVYRGYLIWVFTPLVGLWGAAALSLAAFALAHSYQGLKGVVSVGLLGAVFTLVTLISGSLWPAIVLHAVVDICNGLIAWLALRELPGQAAPVGAPA